MKSIRTKEEIVEKRDELQKDKEKFNEFLQSIYKDSDAKDRILEHMWKIEREIIILTWVLDDELPF